MYCYSLDWHPQDHVSFVDTVHMRKLHPDSKVGPTTYPFLSFYFYHLNDVTNNKLLTPPQYQPSSTHDFYRCQIQSADKCNVYDTVVFEGPPKGSLLVEREPLIILPV